MCRFGEPGLVISGRSWMNGGCDGCSLAFPVPPSFCPSRVLSDSRSLEVSLVIWTSDLWVVRRGQTSVPIQGLKSVWNWGSASPRRAEFAALDDTAKVWLAGGQARRAEDTLECGASKPLLVYSNPEIARAYLLSERLESEVQSKA